MWNALDSGINVDPAFINSGYFFPDPTFIEFRNFFNGLQIFSSKIFFSKV